MLVTFLLECALLGKRALFIPGYSFYKSSCFIKACDSLLPPSNHFLPDLESSLIVWGISSTLRRLFSCLCSERLLFLTSYLLTLDESLSGSLTFPAFLVSDSLPLSSSWCGPQASVQRNPNVQGIRTVPRTQPPGSCLASPLAALGFEIPVNVCWLLSPGMCVRTSSFWGN